MFLQKYIKQKFFKFTSSFLFQKIFWDYIIDIIDELEDDYFDNILEKFNYFFYEKIFIVFEVNFWFEQVLLSLIYEYYAIYITDELFLVHSYVKVLPLISEVSYLFFNNIGLLIAVGLFFWNLLLFDVYSNVGWVLYFHTIFLNVLNLQIEFNTLYIQPLNPYFISFLPNILFFSIYLLSTLVFFLFLYFYLYQVKIFFLILKFILILLLFLVGVVYLQYNYFNIFIYAKQLNLIFFTNVNLVLSSHLIFTFTINKQNVFFILLVLIIFFNSLFFSQYYLIKDTNKNKFFLLLTFFTISMLGFLLSSNIILFFIFWEFIGITSFLLIGYYTNKISAFKSATKALFFNKFSDINFIFAIMIYYYLFNSFSFFELDVINYNNYYINLYIFNVNLLLVFLVFLTIAGFVKSAQFYFYSWLLDSMDAPVPASALIHSATLVMAGIFIIYRFKDIYLFFTNYVIFLIIICSITAIYSNFSAIFQTDLKKLLAYSTISNCSIIIICIFLLPESMLLSYIICHGITKSLLFLLGGFIFNQSLHKQNVYYFSDLKQIYTIFESVIVLQLILSAIPLTLIYYLKHSSIYQVFYLNGFFLFYFYFFFIFITISSIFYTINLISKLLFFKNKDKRIKINDYKLNNFYLLLLLFVSILISFLFCCIILYYLLNLSYFFFIIHVYNFFFSKINFLFLINFLIIFYLFLLNRFDFFIFFFFILIIL